MNEYGKVLMDFIAEFPIDNARGNLKFYDPGLFPVMFGEQPASMFDVSN